jgi:hypothetical protein
LLLLNREGGGRRNQDVTATLDRSQFAAHAGRVTDGKSAEMNKELAIPVGSYEGDISDWSYAGTVPTRRRLWPLSLL